MANFYVNIFGTTHWGGSNQPNSSFVLFNLHVLQVESDITPINFDMFIEFYAFPFNSMGLGTSITAGGSSTQPYLQNRKLVNQPQIIHIDQMTPNVGLITLSNCTGINPIAQPVFPNTCIGGQQPLSPICPNPSDFRLFSHPFQVPINLPSGTFNSSWSDIRDSFGRTSAFVKNHYLLPVKILIIADGCRYENTTSSVRIITTYNNDSGLVNGMFGNAFCYWNPQYFPLAFNEKILVN